MRMITLATAAAIAATSMAQAATLSAVDRNNDGVVSYAEWNFTFGSDESIIGFNYSDRDGNGTLDIHEFNRAVDRGVLAN